ncbi:hypothetical protein B0J14DRAFT_701164 [Halenospora varia]|nr:hypothetical protein B0J14DRAFT_701164 [Halenospora varia]
MRFSTFTSTICGLSLLSTSSATPLPQGTGTGADSCATKELTTTTWTDLKIDDFLKSWAASNVTATTTNNVQSLASSFGAPNFFCGLDNFCNAGQPCLPVELPAWYAMVAIQNWNSYMNSINTAITFASSIASLTLPSIVSDFYPKPKDNVTPLITASKIFTTALGVIPFTGAVSTAASAVSGSVSFLAGRIKPPTETNLFVKWSDVAASLATVVSDYQAAVSTSLKATLDAKVDDSGNGILGVLSGGGFLGIAQNFTQADLQSKVTDSINIYAIGLVLQAQGVFVYRYPSGCTEEYYAELCVDKADGSGKAGYSLIKSDGNSNAELQDDTAKLLLEKYGFTKDMIFTGPAGCFDANGKKQLVDPFTDALPLDKTSQCLFNLQVCGREETGWDSKKGIVDNCRDNQGLAI